jgi:hypothetical protein
MSSRKVRVYIAGPYSHGSQADNVCDAMNVWATLWDLGYIPYCPHWTHFQHMHRPMPYEEWLEFDKYWVQMCDVLLRLPGLSHGADAEVTFAAEHNIPVVKDIPALLRFYPANGKSPARENRPA